MRTQFVLTMLSAFAVVTTRSEKIYSSIAPIRLQSNGTQCSDSDRSIWQSSSSNNRQFYSNIDSCGSAAAGSTDMTSEVSSCLTQIYPDLSASCAECFGSDVDCGATNCRIPCQANSNSNECQTCLEPCSAAVATCTGTTNLPKSDSTSSSGVLQLASIGAAAAICISSVLEL
jgi:hypothetical protein